MSLNKLLLVASLGVASAAPAWAADSDDTPPGVEALKGFREGLPPQNPVQNRFFLKAKRFELAPEVGLVPNNPFVRRFTVALGFGYHFTETLSLQGNFAYAPDLGKRDVKTLAPILLKRATDPNFRQPIDKVTLSASFGVQWAPIYGKINILGETVVNFDFYGYLGLGLVVQNRYATIENPNPQDSTTLQFFNLEKDKTAVHVAPNIGLGGDFFITHALALKLDGRFAIFPDDKPQYDVAVAPEGQRVVSQFTASVGLAIFFPKMKPRLYDF